MSIVTTAGALSTATASGRTAVLFQANECPFCRAFAPEFRRALQRRSDIREVEALLDFEDDTMWTQFAIEEAVGCQPVSLETTDILLGLNTGMINTVAVPPLIGLAGQFYRPAPHMLDMNWAPIVGAAVVRTDIWEKIPPDIRARLKAAAEATGEKLRERGRLESEEAIKVMQQHGLQLHELTPAADAEWQELAAQLQPKVRGAIVPEDIFDAVELHLKNFRAGHKE